MFHPSHVPITMKKSVCCLTMVMLAMVLLSQATAASFLAGSGAGLLRAGFPGTCGNICTAVLGATSQRSGCDYHFGASLAHFGDYGGTGLYEYLRRLSPILSLEGIKT